MQVDFLRAKRPFARCSLTAIVEEDRRRAQARRMRLRVIVVYADKKTQQRDSLLSMLKNELNFFHVGIGGRSKLPRLAQVFRYDGGLTVTGNDAVFIHVNYLLSFLIANLSSFH